MIGAAVEDAVNGCGGIRRDPRRVRSPVRISPAAAHRTTTSHGGVRHRNSSRKAKDAMAKSALERIPDVQIGSYNAASRAHDRRVDAAQRGLDRRPPPEIHPKRQDSDHQKERRQENRDEAEDGGLPTADDSAEIGSECEQRSRHRLCGAVAGQERVVSDPSRRNDLGSQQRQHRRAHRRRPAIPRGRTCQTALTS